jgi:hypothetical protein
MAAGLFVTAGLLGACAATINTSTPSPPAPVSAAHGKTLVLQLVGSPSHQASEDWGEFSQAWRESMQAAAARDRFEFVFATREADLPATPATLVRVSVNDFRYMSQARRSMVGALHGNAFMDVEVAYLEWPGSRAVGSRRINTTTSFWQGPFSAATQKQVAAVTETILGDVRGAAKP